MEGKSISEWEGERCLRLFTKVSIWNNIACLRVKKIVKNDKDYVVTEEEYKDNSGN